MILTSFEIAPDRLGDCGEAVETRGIAEPFDRNLQDQVGQLLEAGRLEAGGVDETRGERLAEELDQSIPR